MYAVCSSLYVSACVCVVVCVCVCVWYEETCRWGTLSDVHIDITKTYIHMCTHT